MGAELKWLVLCGMAIKNGIVYKGDGGWRMFGSLVPAALFLAP